MAPRTSRLIYLLKYRMHTKQESNCIVLYGPKGKGKTFLALKLATVLDPKFTLDRVVFSSKDLFAMLKKGVPAGSVIVYDELAVGASSRDSQTRSNKSLGSIFQTIRPRAITILATCVAFGMVDAGVRNLMDFAIEVKGHSRGITNFKFFHIVPRINKPIPMMQHLIYNDEHGKPVKYINWTAKVADPVLTSAYKEKRDKYLDGLINDAFNTEESGVRYRDGVPIDIKKNIRIDIKKVAAEIEACPVSLKDENGKWDSTLARSELTYGKNTIAQAINLLNRRRPRRNPPEAIPTYEYNSQEGQEPVPAQDNDNKM